MKISLTKLLATALVAFALAVCARAIDMTFFAYPNTGTQHQYMEGDYPTDNPWCYPYLTSPNAPATYLGMPFYNTQTWNCDFEIYFETNGVSSGNYYIGTFSGSTSDFYVHLY